MWWWYTINHLNLLTESWPRVPGPAHKEYPLLVCGRNEYCTLLARLILPSYIKRHLSNCCSNPVSLLDNVSLSSRRSTMESEPIVTIDVQNYRLVLPNGRSKFLLQCPVPHEASHDGKILVRQDQGANNNEVSFKPPRQLVRVDDPPLRTYVHGIFLASRPGGNCRKGDAVWLHDATRKPGSKQDPEAIGVVNLRTWECLTVSLWEICWVPKYRRLEHDDGEEELLTISGRPARHAATKKTYVLAIVQRLRVVDDVDPAGDGPCLEAKEMVEQELFRYQNLNNLPEGTKRIQELFGRMLRAAALTQATQLDTSKSIALERMVGNASALTTPPSVDDDDSPYEEEDDAEFEREAQELINEGMANLTRPARLVVPVRTSPPTMSKQVPAQTKHGCGLTNAIPLPSPQLQPTCNLSALACPTPPQLFFATKSTRPSHTNLFPTHYHVVDENCPGGAAHELHCVYASLNVPDCIIPTTVRHMCCTTGVHPWNKRITKPPALRPSAVVAAAVGGGAGGGGGGGDVNVIVKGGSGVTVVGGGSRPEEAYADLAIDVEIMCFDARRDLDERGRRAFGVDKREDVVDGEWVFARASLDGVVGDLSAATAATAASAASATSAASGPSSGAGDAPMSPQTSESVSDDAFADRHYYGEVDEDENDDDDDDGDTIWNGSNETKSVVSGLT